MQWDAVQTEAKTKGNLVYAMDQAQTAVMTEPGPWGEAYGGYCIGLAARWMSLQYQGKDYPYNPGTQEYRRRRLASDGRAEHGVHDKEHRRRKILGVGDQPVPAWTKRQPESGERRQAVGSDHQSRGHAGLRMLWYHPSS